MEESVKKVSYNRSLERALQILCAFSTEQQTISLAQIAAIVELPKATVMRLCKTLMEQGFLRYDQQEKKYSLGLKLFELGSIVFSSFSLRKVASPYLTQLQLKLTKTAFLGILQDDELIYIDKKDDIRSHIRFASHIGTRRYPCFGMLGQTLMAFLPEKEVDRLLQKKPLTAWTKRSLTDQNKFKQRLAKIRKDGFFIDDEGAINGIAGIAAPVRDFTGEVVAAIGVGFISSSEDKKGREIIIQEVVATARKLSYELGYQQ